MQEAERGAQEEAELKASWEAAKERKDRLEAARSAQDEANRKACWDAAKSRMVQRGGMLRAQGGAGLKARSGVAEARAATHAASPAVPVQAVLRASWEAGEARMDEQAGAGQHIFAAGAWQRVLTADCDVEPNPGPPIAAAVALLPIAAPEPTIATAPTFSGLTPDALKQLARSLCCPGPHRAVARNWWLSFMPPSVAVEAASPTLALIARNAHWAGRPIMDSDRNVALKTYLRAWVRFGRNLAPEPPALQFPASGHYGPPYRELLALLLRTRYVAATGHDAWQRELTEDGDVESIGIKPRSHQSNPSRQSSCPRPCP